MCIRDRPYPVPQLTRDVARASEKNVFLHFPLIGIDSKDWDIHLGYITDIMNWRYITRSSPRIASKHFFRISVFFVWFPPGAIDCASAGSFLPKLAKSGSHGYFTVVLWKVSHMRCVVDCSVKAGRNDTFTFFAFAGGGQSFCPFPRAPVLKK